MTDKIREYERRKAIIEQTADSFCMFMQQRAAGIPVRVLSPGESLELS